MGFSKRVLKFEFLEFFCSSILGVSIYYAPESDLRVKRYDHLNWSRAFIVQFFCVSIYFAPESDLRVKSYDHSNFSSSSVVQFWVSRYIIRLNRTSEWNVMTIRICWELPLFNFERLDILCTWIGPQSEKLWPFEFLESFRSSISSVSIYYAHE